MKLKHNSIFNLIEIFSTPKKTQVQTIDPVAHCEQKQLHDFYCDAEKASV